MDDKEFLTNQQSEKQPKDLRYKLNEFGEVVDTEDRRPRVIRKFGDILYGWKNLARLEKRSIGLSRLI